MGALQPIQVLSLYRSTTISNNAKVVDTVELFSFKRQRKLSLRFLAAFLLRIDIQQQVPDQSRTYLRMCSSCLSEH